MFEVNISIAFPKEPSCVDTLDLVDIVHNYVASFPDAFYSIWVDDDDIIESAVRDKTSSSVNMDLVYEMTRGE